MGFAHTKSHPKFPPRQQYSSCDVDISQSQCLPLQLRVGVGLFSLQYDACLELLNKKTGVMRVVCNWSVRAGKALFPFWSTDVFPAGVSSMQDKTE